MRSSRTLGTELWRRIVEKLDTGVIVFNDMGVVIYANDEAARLLGYTTRDVLGLDYDDLLALCLPGRLNRDRLQRVLFKNELDEQPAHEYEIATSERRIRVRPFRLMLEYGYVDILYMHDMLNWRDELITQAMIADLQGPISISAQYLETLIARIEEGNALPFELADLTRIIQNSMSRAENSLQSLVRLHETDPRLTPDWKMEEVSLSDAIRAAMRELEAKAIKGTPSLRLEMPGDLPLVRACKPHLHAALTALLAGAALRATQDSQFVITAGNRETYVQVTLTPSSVETALPGYMFDALPLAIVEQVILRHGGRITLDTRPDKPTVVIFTLPVWKDE